MSSPPESSAAPLTRALRQKITGITPGWDFYFSEDAPGQFTAEALRDPDHHISMADSDNLALVWKIGQVALDINESLPTIPPEPGKGYLLCSSVAKSMPGALKDFLTAEIYRGNVISTSWNVWGQVVILRRRFSRSRRKVEPPLTYSLINDPHYWCEEVSYEGTKFTVGALWG
ncbi:MAG: hypothetical protein AAGF23_12625 [Acidobacteriota bacterium]